jgi:pseudaminic acid biosynthesis-associated methylase
LGAIGVIMTFKTEQENFWAESFGQEYIDRNKSEKLLASNLDFFTKALKSTQDVKTCIEFGANIGMNIKALKLLYPDQHHSAIEINSDAVNELHKILPKDNIFEGSILDFNPKKVFDLVLIKGVLIHINPDELNNVYDKLVTSCSKYLLVAEYYNPSPVTIPYRGHINRLFKRDFAGEIMDRHPGMKIIDYGFSYRRDPKFPQDDITWFLMEKS